MNKISLKIHKWDDGERLGAFVTRLNRGTYGFEFPLSWNASRIALARSPRPSPTEAHTDAMEQNIWLELVTPVQSNKSKW